MSPKNIVATAAKKGIDILGITDHNSTKHCKVVQKIAAEKGIFVLCGAEVTIKEEVHCITFFKDLKKLQLFQEYLDEKLPSIKNDPAQFGYQVVIDEEETIVEQIDPLLISGINDSIEAVKEKTEALDGIFIPAHIDRPYNSLLSQLGFVSPTLGLKTMEISKSTTEKDFRAMHPELEDYQFISDSDSHYIDDIGKRTNTIHIASRSFDEIRMAIIREKGRFIRINQ